MTKEKEICGIVMPISAIDGCEPSHWTEVKEIISTSISNAGFSPRLVSDADDVGVIQARIVQNLYDNPVVVCDVSGKNPNVMFELGLRLAFDKPTIVIKDDQTSYMFDTGQVEHLEYPRDLRYGSITEFKKLLCDKIKATHEKAKKDPEYSTFLKHFNKIKIAKLKEVEVTGQEYLVKEIKILRDLVENFSSSNNSVRRNFGVKSKLINVYRSDDKEVQKYIDMCFDSGLVSVVEVKEVGEYRYLRVDFESDVSALEVSALGKKIEMDVIPF